MRQVEEIFRQIQGYKSKIKEVEKEVVELRCSTYGHELIDEALAAKFYREIAEAGPEVERREEALKAKEKELENLKAKLENTNKNLFKALTVVKFPLKPGTEGLEKQDNNVIFHFDRGIEDEVLREVEQLIGIDLSTENVKILPNRIVVHNVSIPEAMKEVMAHIEKIRKAAMNQLKIDDYVKELRSRDEKIQRMLYVMYRAGDRALSRKEMEVRAKLEPKSLRGVLYLVEKRDPYIKKVEKGKFKLTEVGKRVMKKYDEKHGSLILSKEELSKTLENYGSSNKGESEG